MKQWICPIAAVGLMIGVGAGCAHKKPAGSMSADSSVTDVSGQPAPMAPDSAYTPAPEGNWDAANTQAPGPAAGGTYTVRKGDTLYGIARAHYGDGKQWQRIADANPGVSPSTLKAGQTINIP